MKIIKPFLCTFLLLVAFSFTLSAQIFNVMTYNIKYDNQSDTINNWEDRKTTMVKLIDHYYPSFVGIQEGLINQVEYLDSSLVDYKYIGVGRDDGQRKGEFSAIFYDTTRFEVIKSSTFWLSDSPEKISVGWDASMERVCTYGLFEEKASKQKFWIFNTHFDHIGIVAREQSAELILKKIQQSNTDHYPVVLMGDLNLLPEEKPIQLIKKKMSDGQEVTENPFYGPGGTFNSFRNEIIDKRIDYIFVNNFLVHTYTHIDDKLDTNKHISDHLPVLATLEVILSED
jgi:endonuclease/exonuclease/phosphatase family metal-dependent hydrolase